MNIVNSPLTSTADSISIELVKPQNAASFHFVFPTLVQHQSMKQGSPGSANARSSNLRVVIPTPMNPTINTDDLSYVEVRSFPIPNNHRNPDNQLSLYLSIAATLTAAGVQSEHPGRSSADAHSGPIELHDHARFVRGAGLLDQFRPEHDCIVGCGSQQCPRGAKRHELTRTALEVDKNARRRTCFWSLSNFRWNSNQT